MSLVLLTLAALGGAAQGREVVGVGPGRMVVERYVDAPSQGVSRMVLDEFAKCIVRRKHDAAARGVLDPDANLGKEREDGLFISDCMPGRTRLRARATQVRYGLAEALTLADAGKLSLDFAGVAPLVHRPFVDRPMPADVAADPRRVAGWNAYAAEHVAYAAVAPFGECVVRAAPAQSLAVLRTRVETAEETAALNALGPVLGPCLAKGSAMKLNKFVMRGTLALNLYRLANAPRGVPAGGVQ
jgi:hypothetical protein